MKLLIKDAHTNHLWGGARGGGVKDSGIRQDSPWETKNVIKPKRVFLVHIFTIQNAKFTKNLNYPSLYFQLVGIIFFKLWLQVIVAIVNFPDWLLLVISKKEFQVEFVGKDWPEDLGFTDKSTNEGNLPVTTNFNVWNKPSKFLELSFGNKNKL